MSTAGDPTAYWKANIRLVTICLVIWALVSFGAGILFRPLLSGITVGGTDLGFWFAQQGSILVFIALIFFYAFRMNALDRKHGVDEEAVTAAPAPAAAAAAPGARAERPAISETDRRAGR